MVNKRSVILLGIVCSFVLGDFAAVAEAGLAAWWKFDEGGGTEALDSAGSHNGTLMDDPNWSSGVDGMALVFDTVGDGVDVGHDSDLNPGTGPFTLAGWILNENTPGSAWKRIITKRGSASAWYSLYLNGSNVTMELVENFPSGYGAYSGGPAIQGDGLWHHVAGVRDDTNDVYFYIDGVQYSAGTSGHNLSNSEILEIGTLGTEAYGGESYKGLMDEVRIYNTALSEG